MPKFIDYHAKLPAMPPEAVKGMQANIKAGKADKFGVKPLNVYMGKNGEAFCMTEAASADDVCKSHEANGIKLSKGDVHEVTAAV